MLSMVGPVGEALLTRLSRLLRSTSRQVSPEVAGHEGDADAQRQVQLWDGGLEARGPLVLRVQIIHDAGAVGASRGLNQVAQPVEISAEATRGGKVR